MPFDQQRYRRRSIRLPGFDYAQAGTYFVTLCAAGRECLFGDVVDGHVTLTPLGEVVTACWEAIPVHAPAVDLDAYVVMPNHLHGLVVITADGANERGIANHRPRTERFGQPVPGSLPTILRSFKAAVTSQVNVLRRTPGAPVWQRNYYEHIVRDDRSRERIRSYIAANPSQWDEDTDNPFRSPPPPTARHGR